MVKEGEKMKNKIKADMPFRMQPHKRGQGNAQKKSRHRKASSELPGGLQGKKENLRGHRKAK